MITIIALREALITVSILLNEQSRIWNPFNCDQLHYKRGCLEKYNCEYGDECKKRFRKHISDIKTVLYSMLLSLGNDDLSDNEVELMYCLSKDFDIQQILEKAVKK